jgi:hypothetical protein
MYCLCLKVLITLHICYLTVKWQYVHNLPFPHCLLKFMLQLHFRIFLIPVQVNGMMISGNSNLDGCHAVVFVPKQTTHFNRRQHRLWVKDQQMHGKHQYISTLSHSNVFRRIRGTIFREFSMSLLNFPLSWQRNGMRAVYCDPTTQTVTIYSSHPIPLSWKFLPPLVSLLIQFIIFCGSAAQRGLWPPRSRGFVIIHNAAPQSGGLLWTSDQPVADTSTWQHTTDKHPCPRWDSNPWSQQASGRRHTR